MSATTTPTIDQILAECHILDIFHIPSFDVKKNPILACQIGGSRTSIGAFGMEHQTQDFIKRECLTKVKKVLAERNERSDMVELIDMIEIGSISNSCILGEYLELDYEQIRYRLFRQEKFKFESYSLMDIFLLRAEFSPDIRRMRRLFTEKKISELIIQWNTDTWIEQASFTCQATGIKHVESKLLGQILDKIDLGSDKTSIPPVIALMKSKYQGVYRITNYDPNTMPLELDEDGPIEGARHIASHMKDQLKLSRVFSFYQLTYYHSGCWMGVAGYKLAELSNEGGAYVFCYSSNPDYEQILKLYKFYIKNFVLRMGD